MQVLPLILGLLNGLDTIYKALIGILWDSTIAFGLSPHFAFLVPFTSYGKYQILGSFITRDIFFQFASLIILVSSTLTLAYNSFNEPKPYSRYLVRITTSVILGSVSFFLMIWVLTALGSLYATIYNTSGVNWSNFLLFSSNSFSSSSHPVVENNYTALIEIFELTGYFTAALSLFAELMLRQALMLLALLLLPIGTVLYSLEHAKKFAVILWEILIEMSAYPFLVLGCLYLGHLFSWDMPLQLAFLFLPSLIPGILFATGNSFLSAPVMGFIGGLSLSRTVGKGVEAGSIAAGIVEGAGAASTIKRGISFPVTERNPLAKNKVYQRTSRDMPWKELLGEELKYRKE